MVLPADPAPLLPAPRTRSVLTVWALFWLLMITIAVQDHWRQGHNDLWRPLLWEGSSCLVASVIAAGLWRRLQQLDARLAKPAHWFGAALAPLAWAAPVFVATLYTLRHGVYALLGEVYRHGPWVQVFVQEMLRFALFYGLFAAVVFGWRSHAAMGAERLRAEQALALSRQAQLTQLAQQLQPHFLFNALNTIAEVVHQDAERGDALLMRLAALLRAASDVAARPFVPLADELALAEGYLAIMRERFAGRLVATVNTDPAALAVEVPSLALQPLLDNAFRHGVERESGAAEVSLQARLEGSGTLLVIEVACNLGSVDVAAPRGVGLTNLQQRLAAARGDRASVSVLVRPGGGSLATLRWPVTASS